MKKLIFEILEILVKKEKLDFENSNFGGGFRENELRQRGVIRKIEWEIKSEIKM